MEMCNPPGMAAALAIPDGPEWLQVGSRVQGSSRRLTAPPEGPPEGPREARPTASLRLFFPRRFKRLRVLLRDSSRRTPDAPKATPFGPEGSGRPPGWPRRAPTQPQS
eukprot:9114026-Pyramimonas_sp.AAC.1